MTTKQTNRNRKKSRLSTWVKRISLGFFTILILGGVSVSAYTTYKIVSNLSTAKAINQTELKQQPNSEIYDITGQTLVWTNSKYQHRPLEEKDTPQILKDLLISTEDKTFYQNKGWSPKQTLLSVYSVLKDHLTHRSTARGGSTVTQQLIKNIRGRNLKKQDMLDIKIQEIALAQKLTENYSKDAILNAYFNKVGFLENAYGFNTAYYLLYGETIQKDKVDAKSIARYAMIVGMLKNPSIYNPRTNPKLALARRNQVLANAYNNHKLTKKLYEEAKMIPIEDGLKGQGWFTDQVYQVSKANGSYVHSILAQLKEYGYNLENTEYPIKVISNLNIGDNEWLQNAVKTGHFYANERQEVAVTVVEPKTGRVIAQVGSRNGASSTDLNRATQTVRSSGSTIKPFLDYAPLLEYGNYSENSTFNANTTTYAGTNIVVRNYGGYQYGTVTMQYALQLSLNVPAVTALSLQEPWMNETIMSNLGLSNHTYDDKGTLQQKTSFAGSDALGINESTQHFAGAFAALANRGKYTTPMYIKSVTQNGETLNLNAQTRQAISPKTAYQLLSMLQTTTRPNSSATSAAIPEYQGYAVKTGTVGMADEQPIYADKEHQQYLGTAAQVAGGLLATDSWMSGTTKSTAVSVWTGFDDQARYGDWIDSTNQTRSDIFTTVMRHFNTGKDTSAFEATNEKVTLNNAKSKQDMLAVDTKKKQAITSKTTKVQAVTKNILNPSKEEKKFYQDFRANQLKPPYEGIKPFVEENNILGYLYKQENKAIPKLYQIDSDGNLVDTKP